MQEPSDERFDRYFADGLRTELEFKGHIETNIAERGEIIPLETKMLRSIENTIMASEMSEDAISNAKKLPDLAAIVQSLGLGRLIYVAAQKMGSHHVHGTWTSLLMHYLEERSEAPSEFAPRGHDCSTHINQYMFVSKIVLMMMAGYVRLVFGEEDPRTSSACLRLQMKQ
jgi:hypothetical protein